MLVPLHIAVAVPAPAVGSDKIVTTMLSDDEQPFTSVPTTVYVVDDMALDIGLATIGLLNDAAGDQR